MSSLDGVPGYFGLYEGIVIDVDDKLGLHRLRADIHGVCRESAWARPRTMGGGAPQRGGNAVPAVGSLVLVQFVGGDILRPVYEGGPWRKGVGGASELPSDIVAAGGSPEVASFELRRGETSVRLTIDEREGHRAWRVAAVQGTKTIGSIELDIEQRVLELFALGGVQLRSLGFVDIKALASRIQKRRVRRAGGPI